MFFSGVACFSPQVGKRVRDLWQENGGTIATSMGDLGSVSFFIAAVKDKFWITSLKAISVMVYNETWVLDSVQQGNVAASRHYELSDGLTTGHAVLTTPSERASMPYTDEETMIEDGTASELEVERTLVGEEEKVEPLMPVGLSAVRLQSLLECFKSSSENSNRIEISLARLVDVTPAVVHCVSFRPGGEFQGVPFNAIRKFPGRVANKA